MDDANAAVLRQASHMIRGIKVAMLTTTAPDGSLYSRPMATHEADFDGSLWFYTKSDSGKVDDILHDSDVNLSYVSPDDHRYLSASGKATVVRDADKLRELWNPSYGAWFPRGLDDPDLALLRVDVESIAYWDMLAGGMTTMRIRDTTGR